jgi:hypothetical protein
MNTATTTADTAAASTQTGLSRFLKALRKEVRYALELAGAPYKDGFLPPL